MLEAKEIRIKRVYIYKCFAFRLIILMICFCIRTSLSQTADVPDMNISVSLKKVNSSLSDVTCIKFISTCYLLFINYVSIMVRQGLKLST